MRTDGGQLALARRSADPPALRLPPGLDACLGKLTAQGSLPDSVEAMVSLGRWVIDGPALTEIVGGDRGPSASRRLRWLLFALDRSPMFEARWRSTVSSIVADTSILQLFCEVGLPNPRGLGAEMIDRTVRVLLPPPPDVTDAGEVLGRIFCDQRDVDWLAAADPALIARLDSHLGAELAIVRERMRQAILVLNTRVSAFAMLPDLHERMPSLAPEESPFFRLPGAPLEQLPTLIGECRSQMQAVLTGLEERGVSVDLVYRLDGMDRCLSRVELLAGCLAPTTDGIEGWWRRAIGLKWGRSKPALPGPAASEQEAHPQRELMVALATARVRDRSLFDVVRASSRLLALKIIERSGHAGEHYITTTWREYFQMMRSAGGGGVLTAATCALRFATKWGHFAPLIDGLLSSSNYALSFIIMQLFGFTLATKQPSLTAASIAASICDLDANRAEHDLEELVSMIARVCRSQLAAAMGNVGFVIPAAFVFHHLYFFFTGRSFLDAATAKSVILSLHPLESGTIFYAVLTGVILWCSSLGAGWIENFTVYRRVPDVIAHHRWGRWIGRQRMKSLARFVERNTSMIGGSVTLGFLLGMTPVFGSIAGLPLDTRHLTLSTGSLTLAVAALDPQQIDGATLAGAVVGVILIGSLNFGVSFVLALRVALRAREVGFEERVRLGKAVIRRFYRHPSEFVLPPKRERRAAA
jgi:site-specific recombinase